MVKILMTWSSLAWAGMVQVAPLTVECSIYSRDFPGIKNIRDYKYKAVTLAGLNDEKDGQKLVDKIGDYEFWVVSGETLGSATKQELFTYKAEIRNTKTGVTAQARSGSDIKPAAPKGAIKRADVALVTYKTGSLMESSSLSMNCMHHPSSAEALNFSH